MPSESIRTALFDIRDNIMFAQGFVRGLDYANFRESRLHFYAATRALEIVSEASRRLPDEVRDRHPHLPWRAIRDAGNLFIGINTTTWRSPLSGTPCTGICRRCWSSFSPNSRAGRGRLNRSPRKLSGFLPGYAERGALRF
jgi:uncharacterized protein with HEPN domain